MTGATLLRFAATASLVLAAASCGDDAGSTARESSTLEPTSTTQAPAAFTDAVRAGDLDAIQATFADDIELFSPVLAEPFAGSARVERLFAVLVDVFEDIEILDEIATPTGLVLRFEARVGDEPIEIVDFLELDDDGRIQTFTVTSRPLAGTQELAAAVAPHLADIEAAPGPQGS